MLHIIPSEVGDSYTNSRSVHTDWQAKKAKFRGTKCVFSEEYVRSILWPKCLFLVAWVGVGALSYPFFFLTAGPTRSPHTFRDLSSMVAFFLLQSRSLHPIESHFQFILLPCVCLKLQLLRYHLPE